MRALRVLLAAATAVLLIFTSIVRTIDNDAIARDKNLSADLLDLASAAQRLAPTDVVYVDGKLGKWPFMASRWIAYCLRNTPLVYAPSLQEGGYIYDLGRDYQERVSQITHILRGVPQAGSHSAGAIYWNGSYEIVPLDAIPAFLIFGPGAFLLDGEQRWIGSKALISVIRAPPGTRLHLEFIGRSPSATGIEQVDLITSGGKTILPVPDGRGSIDIPLEKTPKSVEILSGLTAGAAMAAGKIATPREMALRMAEPTLTPPGDAAP